MGTCEQPLNPDELSALRVLTLGFRGGAPLRSVLDATEAGHGTLAWGRPAAQRAALEATVLWRPRDAPGNFAWGSRRSSRFLRLLIDEIDRAQCVASEELVQAAANAAVSRRATATPDVPHVVLRAPDGGDVVLRVGHAADVGLRLWEAGAAAFLAILGTPLVRNDVAGCNVLEIGSGLGLSAYALARAGANRAVLSDASGAVLDVLRANVRHVGASATATGPSTTTTQLRVTRLNVCEAAEVARACLRHTIDTIFVADVTYDPSLAVAVVRAIESVVIAADSQERKIVAYIFATKRSDVVDKTFRKALNSTALNIEEIPLALHNASLDESSFGILLNCNKTWDLCKVRLYRLT